MKRKSPPRTPLKKLTLCQNKYLVEWFINPYNNPEPHQHVFNAQDDAYAEKYVEERYFGVKGVFRLYRLVYTAKWQG